MDTHFKRFIEVFIPGTACNFNCHYCYLAQNGTSTKQHAKFQFSREQMKRAIRTERLGGSCLFNLCADGETLLEPRTLDFLFDILEEGHYAVVVTNGTLSKRFDEILKWKKELRRKIVFIFSFHYLELQRLNMMEAFFNNIKKAKSAGCSYYVTVVQCEEYIEHYKEIKDLFRQKLDIMPQIVKYRDDQSSDIHIKSNRSPEEYFNLGIDEFHSELFKFEKSTYQRRIDEFCYAGDWQFYLNACTGEMRACYCQPIFGNLFKNPEEPVSFRAIGNYCKCPYCYNGAARLPFGVVPDLRFDYYWQHVQCLDSEQNSSITEYMKEVLSTQLWKTNIPYTETQKKKANRSYIYNYDIGKLPKIHPLRIKRKLKSIFAK